MLCHIIVSKGLASSVTTEYLKSQQTSAGSTDRRHSKQSLVSFHQAPGLPYDISWIVGYTIIEPAGI